MMIASSNEPTKPTKTASVSSVGSSDTGVQENKSWLEVFKRITGDTVSAKPLANELTKPTEEELRAIAGTDWLEVEADPELLGALASAVQVRRMREHGQVPAHYTAVTECRHCGPVPIFAGAPKMVDGCPWCWNRLAGRPIPQARPLIDKPL